MKKKCYKGILADLDGTVNRGRKLIPGVKTVYRDLIGRGVRWIFVSNSATRLAEELAEKINGLGLAISVEQVINSASAMLDAIRTKHVGAKVMVVGESGLAEGIAHAGACLVDDPGDADVVAVAMDSGFTYDKLKRAHTALRRGAIFWATNLDPTFPVENDFHPGAGSIVAAIATAAERNPDRVFGKPYPDMAELSLDVLGIDREACLVVGDRMETDILFAKNAGMDSALVLTGASSRSDLVRFSYSPDHILDSIADLRNLFD